MQFGIVGLGRMGANLSRQAVEDGHLVVGYDRNAPAVEELSTVEGFEGVGSLAELVMKLPTPRVVLIYVPHGAPTDAVVDELIGRLSPGDVLADAGNSHWEESKKHYTACRERGVWFLDIGTSGGLAGAREGACFMVGGDREAFDLIRPLLADLAVDPAGVIHTGPAGSGHFTKLIHNAIEFGMIQAIAEGVEMLQRSEYELDLPALFKNWMHGSVIRSWLVELMGKALGEQMDFAPLSTYVEDTGEVKWAVEWALRKDIPAPVVSLSQTALMQYRDKESAQAKAVALLRNQFGGHPVHWK
jgi:6-phosphogluconate dehydrogenase